MGTPMNRLTWLVVFATIAVGAYGWSLRRFCFDTILPSKPTDLSSTFGEHVGNDSFKKELADQDKALEINCNGLKDSERKCTVPTQIYQYDDMNNIQSLLEPRRPMMFYKNNLFELIGTIMNEMKMSENRPKNLSISFLQKLKTRLKENSENIANLTGHFVKLIDDKISNITKFISTTNIFDDVSLNVEMKTFYAQTHLHNFSEFRNTIEDKWLSEYNKIFLLVHKQFKDHDGDRYAKDVYRLMLKLIDLYGEHIDFKSIRRSFVQTFTNYFVISNMTFDEKINLFVQKVAVLSPNISTDWHIVTGAQRYAAISNLSILEEKLPKEFDVVCVNKSLSAMGNDLKLLDINSNISDVERGTDKFLDFYVSFYKTLLLNVDSNVSFGWLKPYYQNSDNTLLIHTFFKSIMRSKDNPRFEYVNQHAVDYFEFLKRVLNSLKIRDKVSPDVYFLAMDYLEHYRSFENVTDILKTISEVHVKIENSVNNQKAKYPKNVKEVYGKYFNPTLYWLVMVNVNSISGTTYDGTRSNWCFYKYYDKYLWSFVERYRMKSISDINYLDSIVREDYYKYLTFLDILHELANRHKEDIYYCDDFKNLFEKVYKHKKGIKSFVRKAFVTVFAEKFKNLYPGASPQDSFDFNRFYKEFSSAYETERSHVFKSNAKKLYNKLSSTLDMGFDSFKQLYDKAQNIFEGGWFREDLIKNAIKTLNKSANDVVSAKDEESFISTYDELLAMKETTVWHGYKYYKFLKTIENPILNRTFVQVMEKLGNEYDRAVRIHALIETLPYESDNFVTCFVNTFRNVTINASIDVYQREVLKALKISKETKTVTSTSQQNATTNQSTSQNNITRTTSTTTQPKKTTPLPKIVNEAKFNADMKTFYAQTHLYNFSEFRNIIEDRWLSDFNRIFMLVHHQFPDHEGDRYAKDVYQLMLKLVALYGDRIDFRSMSGPFVETFTNYFVSSKLRFDEKADVFVQKVESLSPKMFVDWNHLVQLYYSESQIFPTKLSNDFDVVCVNKSLSAMGKDVELLRNYPGISKSESGTDKFLDFYVPCYKTYLLNVDSNVLFNWLNPYYAKSDNTRLIIHTFFKSIMRSKDNPYFEYVNQYKFDYFKFLQRVLNTLKIRDKVPSDVYFLAMDYFKPFYSHTKNFSDIVQIISDIHKKIENSTNKALNKEQTDLENYYGWQFYDPMLYWLAKFRGNLEKVVGSHHLERNYDKYLWSFMVSWEMMSRHFYVFKRYLNKKNFDINQEFGITLNEFNAKEKIENIYYCYGFTHLFEKAYDSLYGESKLDYQYEFVIAFANTFLEIKPPCDVERNSNGTVVKNFMSNFSQKYKKLVEETLKYVQGRLYKKLRVFYFVKYYDFKVLYHQVKSIFPQMYFNDSLFEEAYIISAKDNETSLIPTYDELLKKTTADWHGYKFHNLLKTIEDPILNGTFVQVMEKLGNEYDNAERIFNMLQRLDYQSVNFVDCFVNTFKKVTINARIEVYQREMKELQKFDYVEIHTESNGKNKTYLKINKCAGKTLERPTFVETESKNIVEVCNNPKNYGFITDETKIKELEKKLAEKKPV